jgi:hypothetical protein
VVSCPLRLDASRRPKFHLRSHQSSNRTYFHGAILHLWPISEGEACVASRR